MKLGNSCDYFFSAVWFMKHNFIMEKVVIHDIFFICTLQCLFARSVEWILFIVISIVRD